MKTKASFLGHPVHMSLVHFPIAFLSGAFLLDVAAKMLSTEELSTVAAYLLVMGVPSGVLASIPGIIDLATSVPKHSRPNAIRHMAVSMLSLLAFGAAWYARGGMSGSVGAGVLTLEGIGAVFIGLSGFLGGNLVLKDLIGPHT